MRIAASFDPPPVDSSRMVKLRGRRHVRTAYLRSRNCVQQAMGVLSLTGPSRHEGLSKVLALVRSLN